MYKLQLYDIKYSRWINIVESNYGFCQERLEKELDYIENNPCGKTYRFQIINPSDETVGQWDIHN